MPERDIASAATSNMDSRVDAYSVDSRNTDGAKDQDETTWINAKWSQYFGYYKQIPELKRAIDARAIWTVGKGYTADTETEIILENIHGWGADTFNTILKNMIITAQINGDAYAEIIRDWDGLLINLKPLDPGSLRIVVDKKGIIKRYEQINKTGAKNAAVIFQPRDIFHLCRDRVGDEIHGVSIVESVEWVILARNEVLNDVKKLMHYHVKPRMAFKVDTDNTAKIDAFSTKMDAAINKGENIYIPKDTVEFELIAVSPNATLNPMPWLENLSNFFYQAVGIPQIIVGGSQEFTEATAKIAYLSFQQSVEDWQMDIERQVWEQLYLKIELDFPANLQNDLITDTKKDGAETAMQPQDMAASMSPE